MKISELPDYISVPFGLLFEKQPQSFNYNANPKFVKWVNISRFKYEDPDRVLQLAERLRNIRFYSRGTQLYSNTTDGIWCATIIVGALDITPSLFLSIACDYLASCNQSIHSVTAESFGHGFYDFKFTFSPKSTNSKQSEQ